MVVARVVVFSEGDEETRGPQWLIASEIIYSLFRVRLAFKEVFFDLDSSMDLQFLSPPQEALVQELPVSRSGEVALFGRLRTESLTDVSIIVSVRREGNAIADHLLFPLCTQEFNAVIFLDLLSRSPPLGDASAWALSATMLTHEGAISFTVINVSRKRWSAVVILAVKKCNRG
jgi:hypothetical protein